MFNRFLFFLFGFLIAVSTVQANDLDVVASLDAKSSFVWRGQAIGEKNNLVFNPAIAFNMGNLSFGGVGSAFLQNRDSLKAKDEVVLSAGYTHVLKNLTLNAGISHNIYFTEANGDPATELSLALSFPMKFSPSVTVHYNFSDAARWGFDWYVTAGANTDIGDFNLAIEVGGSDADGFGFSDATVTLSTRLGFKSIDIVPAVHAVHVNEDTRHYLGTVGFEFGR